MTSFGDVTHTFPISHAMARHWPEAKIDWLVRRQAAPLVECLPWIDDTIAYDLTLRDGWSAFWRRTIEVAGILRNNRYDLAIDFQGLLRTSIWTLLGDAGPGSITRFRCTTIGERRMRSRTRLDPSNAWVSISTGCWNAFKRRPFRGWPRP
jgi:ADP-heptose:LPS heptosyltransferase